MHVALHLAPEGAYGVGVIQVLHHHHPGSGHLENFLEPFGARHVHVRSGWLVSGDDCRDGVSDHSA